MKFLSSSYKIAGPVALGAGVLLVAPLVMPVVASVLRPVAKAAIKGSLIAYEKMRVSLAETVETFEDIAAEAKAELAGDAEPAPAKPKKKVAAEKA